MAEMDIQWMQRFLCLPASCSSFSPTPDVSLQSVINEKESKDVGYSCPFCFDDFDIGTLCSHLEDKHCFDTNDVSCPVCAAKVGMDLVAHIQLHHGQLFKMQRRRRSQKVGLLNQSLAASEKDSTKSSVASSQSMSSMEAALILEEQEQQLQAEELRALFVRQLVYSTLFNDSIQE